MAARSGWLSVESGGKAQGDLTGAGGLDLVRTEQRLGQGEDRRAIEEVGKRRVLLGFAAIGLGAQGGQIVLAHALLAERVVDRAQGPVDHYQGHRAGDFEIAIAVELKFLLPGQLHGALRISA